MSYDYDYYDDYYEEGDEDLYEEHKRVAIEQFTEELLQSYYLSNKLIAKSAFDFLSEAKNLYTINTTASLIHSAISIEVGLKSALLKPIVFGLVHSEPFSELITDLSVSRANMDKYRKLLFLILKQHGGVDLAKYKRKRMKKLLWQEIKETQQKRNSILHRADTANKWESKLALKVSSEILHKIFPTVLKKLNLHLHNGFEICDKLRCKY